MEEKLRKIIDPNNECCCEYHLMAKCKEWAYNKGYIIKTDIAGEWELYNFKNGGIFDTQNSSSEQQAVFDACMYILDKDKQ